MFQLNLFISVEIKKNDVSFVLVAYGREYLLRLKSNAPAIKGSVVTFTADLLEASGTPVAVSDYKWVRLLHIFFSLVNLNDST